MDLFCQSVNFMDCSADAAAEIVLDKSQQGKFLCLCRDCSQINDALILNTCNRLEFYFYAQKHFDVSGFIDNFILNNFWKQHRREFCGIDVASHLFKVAAGLESQIIGENEIFSQLKSAYSFALNCGTVKFMFHHLMHSAFRVAKAVRTQTNISAGALSVAGAAVALAAVNREIEEAKVFVIGCGDNAELIVKHLIKKKVRDITVVARNHISAARLIEKTAGKFLPLEHLAENISYADIIFTATASYKPLIEADMIKKRSNLLMLIDVSVPPNVGQGVKDAENVKVFDMNSLNAVIHNNNRNRQNEIPKAQMVINQHLPEFAEWFRNSHNISMVS